MRKEGGKKWYESIGIGLGPWRSTLPFILICPPAFDLHTYFCFRRVHVEKEDLFKRVGSAHVISREPLLFQLFSFASKISTFRW